MKKEPKLFIIAGFPGSGKTTVAGIIAKKLKIKIYTTDKIWREKEFKSRAIKYHNAKSFFPEYLRRQFYKKLMSYAEKEINCDRSVILDATFSNSWTREYAFKLAKKLKVEIIPIEVQLNKIKDEEIIKRSKKRIQKDNLAADANLYWVYKKHHRQSSKGFIIINNDGTLTELKKQINKILKKIRL